MAYEPGSYYTMGWNDRYSGKNNDSFDKKGIWTEPMIEEYNSGYSDCTKKIMNEVRGNVSNRNEGKIFIQE